LIQTINLLKPYKNKIYLPLAEDNRNRITVSYRNGGASLLDLLDRRGKLTGTLDLAYLNLTGRLL